jgi:hypothetical protein
MGFSVHVEIILITRKLSRLARGMETYAKNISRATLIDQHFVTAPTKF